MRSPYGFEISDDCKTCTLRQEGFFCDLSPAALGALNMVKISSAYPTGSILFVEGDEPRGIFTLCRGRVKVSVTSGEGKAVILRIAGPGDVLGLHGVVSGKPYQASAESLEPCQVNFVRREDFLRFLRSHPEASLSTARQLSQNYHTACEQVRALGLAHSAPAKLAGFLLDWASRGAPTREGMRIKLTLTHEQIGQMVGLSRETVTRTLSDFKQRQLVRVKGATLVIQDKAGLQHYCQA